MLMAETDPRRSLQDLFQGSKDAVETPITVTEVTWGA